MTEYQKYQLHWMVDHGYSLDDLMDELTRFQYNDPEDSNKISTPVSELFGEWAADAGFGSEIWACEAEWFDCERENAVEEIVDAEFTSVWDGGFCVTTSCKVNLATREIFDIETSEDAADSYDNLDKEYVTISGFKHPVVEANGYDDETEKMGYYWYK